MTEFYPNDVFELELIALNNQLETYIIDKLANKEFIQIKGIVDLAEQIVQTSNK